MSRHFTGEWDGVMCAFDKCGKLKPIASHLIPQEYSEWGIEVYDWQV